MNVSEYGRYSYIGGWLLAGGLTTLYERGRLWSFWPTALLGVAVIVGAYVVVGVLGSRVERKMRSAPTAAGGAEGDQSNASDLGAYGEER